MCLATTVRSFVLHPFNGIVGSNGWANQEGDSVKFTKKRERFFFPELAVRFLNDCGLHVLKQNFGMLDQENRQVFVIDFVAQSSTKVCAIFSIPKITSVTVHSEIYCYIDQLRQVCAKDFALEIHVILMRYEVVSGQMIFSLDENFPTAYACVLTDLPDQVLSFHPIPLD